MMVVKARTFFLSCFFYVICQAQKVKLSLNPKSRQQMHPIIGLAVVKIFSQSLTLAFILKLNL